MSSKFLNSSVMYLHTDRDGSVWAGRKSEVPIPFHGDYAELLEYKFVRMLGWANNAELISEIRKQSLPEVRVQLGSPSYAENTLRHPVNAIYRMRQYMMPASVGGWHDVNDIDYATYSLVEGSIDMTLHPLWKRLAFANNLDHEKVAQIVKWVLDPRWFVVQAHPGRMNKVFAHLGLLPEILEDLKEGKTSDRVLKLKTVCEAWNSGKLTKVSVEDKRNFLYADCARAAEGVYTLNTAKLFVSFIIWNWRQLLADQTPQRPELFIPSELLGVRVGGAFKEYFKGQ